MSINTPVNRAVTDLINSDPALLEELRQELSDDQLEVVNGGGLGTAALIAIAVGMPLVVAAGAAVAGVAHHIKTKK